MAHPHQTAGERERLPRRRPADIDVTAAGPVRIPKLVSMTAPSWGGENAGEVRAVLLF